MSSLSNGTLSTYYVDQLWVSIEDMPIWNWNKIVEEGSLKFLFKKYDKQVISQEVQDVWMDLQQQHVDEFGIDEALNIRMKNMRKVIALNLKFFETRDRSLLNLIAIEELRIEGATSNIKHRFTKVLNHVSKHMGFRINAKDFSVKEWYHALKDMEAAHGKDNKG